MNQALMDRLQDAYDNRMSPEPVSDDTISDEAERQACDNLRLFEAWVESECERDPGGIAATLSCVLAARLRPGREETVRYAGVVLDELMERFVADRASDLLERAMDRRDAEMEEYMAGDR